MGPANTVFAVWVVSDAVNVPASVTGLPLTLKMGGIDKPTLVTVPPAVVLTIMLPGPVVMAIPDPAIRVVATTEEPVDPTYNWPSIIWGRSARTWVRNVGSAAAPVVGPANIELAN
jgi:hypothetical protein